MSIAKETITGIVLAGGKSSRMGTDKGLLPLQGKPMVAHVLDQLRPCVEELLLVANKPEYDAFGCRRVADLLPGLGPVGGIYTGLRACTTPLALVLSCDMPFITNEAIYLLLAGAGTTPISLASLQGRMQPLLGLYHSSCLPLFAEAARSGKLRLQELILQTAPTLVPMDALAAAQPLLFHNLNTPQDLALAETYTHL